jgi:hypothetical protein
MKTKFYIPLFYLLFSTIGYSQTGIGSYSALDGGFENHATGNIQGGSTSAVSFSRTLWSASTTSGSAIARAISATGGRTGPQCASFGSLSTTAKSFYTPVFSGSSFAANTTYQIQFYYKPTTTTATLASSSVDLYIDNSSLTAAPGSIGTKVSVPAGLSASVSSSSWTKIAVQITTAGTVGTNGLAAISFTTAASSTNFTANFDDFVIYEANSPDTTAPSSPGTISATGTTGGGSSVSWVAANGGEDGGGYVVVRYATTAPLASDDLVQNGIYKIGNTIAGGGVVRYIGTSTSFNDTGLSPGVDYYYKVYTVDKAFNYSDESVTNSAVQALATTYYYKGTGLLTDLANWGLNTDGTGTSPADFTATSQVFEIRNTTSVTLDGSWTVGADPSNGTKVRLGNSSESAITLTLNLGSSIGPAGTGNFDVISPSSGNQKVVYKNTTAISFGNILDSNFEVNYDGVIVSSASTKSFGTVSIINGANVAFTATPVIKNILVDPTSILTLPLSASSAFITIPSGGSVVINGTIKVPKLTGFVSSNVGTPSDTFGALQFIGTENLTLGNNSTVEYVRTATGMQSITARSDYKNLILSGTTPKNINGPTTVSGTFTINQTGPAAVTLAGNITLNGSLTQTSGKLTIGAFTLTMNGGYQGDATNSLVGSAESNLITTGTVGTLYFDQTTPGTTNVIKNLTLSSGTATIGNSLNITAGSSSGTVIVGTGASLTTGDFLTLKSDANGTASVGNSAGTISGNVTVERYIPSKRAWRALTAPVIGSTNNSVFYNWQNNGTIVSNTGVEIWSNGSGLSGVTSGGIGSSLLSYDSISNNWSGVTNTNTTLLFSNNYNNPFMVFVTGPYGSSNISGGQAITTLKATGQLITGDKNYSTIANKFTFIGNPYACPLDLSALLNNSQNATASFGGNIWVWDANASGSNQVGTYNLFNSGTYTNITSNTAVVTGTQIQSGQSFFVKSNDGATFTIKESHKGTSVSNAVFRNGDLPELLRVGLYKQIDNEWYGRDGAMTVLLSDADANQAPNKMANSTENIAFTKNGASFASNHHLPLVATDVLEVKVWNTTAGSNYKLKLNTEVFTASHLAATLEDLYTNSRTSLNLDGSPVEYPFSVTNDALSTGNRFRIVFQNAVLGNNNSIVNGFSIVPNPVSGDTFQVNLGALATGTYSYSIYNSIGQEVGNGTINSLTQNTNYEVKMSNAATGIYIMKIKGSDNSVYTAKIIKK